MAYASPVPVNTRGDLKRLRSPKDTDEHDAWEALPEGFEGKPFEFERDPARRFVEFAKGGSSDPPEKKIANMSDASLWTGESYLSFLVQRNSKGVFIHAASPLAPSFLARPGVARALIETALEHQRVEPLAYKSEKFAEDGGYGPGLQALQDEAQQMGVHLRMLNETLPVPWLRPAKNTRTKDLREKIDPLCLALEYPDENGGASGRNHSRKRQVPVVPAYVRKTRQRKGRAQPGDDGQYESLAEGTVPAAAINEQPHMTLDASHLDQQYHDLLVGILDADPTPAQAHTPAPSKLDCWRTGPLASPLAPTVIPTLILIVPTITSVYIDL